MDNRKKYFYLSLAIVSILVITTCVTYAFFNYSRSGTTENSITMGDITFIYDEIDKVGRGINLENALPMSDSDAMKLTGEGNAFNFKIKSHTPEGIVIPYIITARKKGDNIGNIIKVSLTEVIDSVTEEEVLPPTYYNALDDFDETVDKVIKIMQVPENSNNYEKNFRLRMWISNKDINGNTVNIGEYSNKEFELKINVESKGRQVAAQEPESDGSYSSILPANTSNKGIILAWEYTGSGNTPTSFPNKTDGYIATKVICNGKTGIFDNDNWALYLPIVTGESVNCTVTFADVNYQGLARMVLNENTLVVTPPRLNNTSAGDTSGLYASTDTNSGNTTYYFRGNVTNNIVDFAGFTWRIVRINEDGTVRLIMETGINNTAYPYQSGNNKIKYMYFSTHDANATTAKTRLDDWYKTNITDKGYGDKVSTGGYFCEQAKVASNSSHISASGANMLVYNANGFKPDFKCVTDANNHGIVETNVGLITYDEVVYAGGYPNIDNTNYYLYTNYDFWTMSPAGIYSDGRALIWHSLKNLTFYGAEYNLRLRPVINLKANVTATKNQSTGHYVVD